MNVKIKNCTFLVALISLATILIVIGSVLAYSFVNHRISRKWWGYNVHATFADQVGLVNSKISEFATKAMRLPTESEFALMQLDPPKFGLEQWVYKSQNDWYLIEVYGSPSGYPKIWYSSKDDSISIDQ